MIDVPLPVFVVGDIHGNFHDLLRILTWVGTGRENRYVFLGGYVDRGSYSLDVILLLFTLKCVNPSSIYLLRGNHEFSKVNEQYGFKEECEARYPGSSIWERANKLFAYLPLGVVLNRSIICLHGGIGPACACLQSLRRVALPLDEAAPPEMISQYVWSGPVDHTEGFMKSPRGLGFNFGKGPLMDYLRDSHCKMMIRAHECVMHGVSSFGDGLGMTIFSCSNYTGRGNLGAFAEISASRALTSHQYAPPERLIERQEAEFDDGIPFEPDKPQSEKVKSLSAQIIPSFKVQSYPLSKPGPVALVHRRSSVYMGRDGGSSGRKASLAHIGGSSSCGSSVTLLTLCPLLDPSSPR